MICLLSSIVCKVGGYGKTRSTTVYWCEYASKARCWRWLRTEFTVSTMAEQSVKLIASRFLSFARLGLESNKMSSVLSGLSCSLRDEHQSLRSSTQDSSRWTMNSERLVTKTDETIWEWQWHRLDHPRCCLTISSCFCHIKEVLSIWQKHLRSFPFQYVTFSLKCH